MELLTDYLEGALSAEQELRVREHLALCDACGAYVEQMRQTIAALGHVEADSVPPAVEAELVAAFRDWRAG